MFGVGSHQSGDPVPLLHEGEDGLSLSGKQLFAAAVGDKPQCPYGRREDSPRPTPPPVPPPPIAAADIGGGGAGGEAEDDDEEEVDLNSIPPEQLKRLLEQGLLEAPAPPLEP